MEADQRINFLNAIYQRSRIPVVPLSSGARRLLFVGLACPAPTDRSSPSSTDFSLGVSCCSPFAFWLCFFASFLRPSGPSFIIAAGRLFSIFEIREFQSPIPFKMPYPSSGRSSNLHRADTHQSIHITTTYRRTRTGFCVVLICSTHLFWNNTSTKVSEPTCSFGLPLKLSTLSYHKYNESLYPKVC
jgi:hypothetical protein